MSWTTIVIIIFLFSWIINIFGSNSNKGHAKNNKTKPAKRKENASSLPTQSPPALDQGKKKTRIQQSPTIIHGSLLPDAVNNLKNKTLPEIEKNQEAVIFSHNLLGKEPSLKAVEEYINDPEKIRKLQIQEFVKERGIDFLVHFTRVENLQQILQYGLIGRKSIISREIPSIFNDKYRFDGLEDAVCASISFPNYKMFYSLQMQNRTADWAIVKLRPSILWETNCAFCATNAAGAIIKNIPIEQRKKVESLKSMFADSSGVILRKNLGIPENFPTDPQAEVLLLDAIDPAYILDVTVNNKEKIKNPLRIFFAMQSHAGKINLVHDGSFFSPRKDYNFWKKEVRFHEDINDDVDTPF